MALLDWLSPSRSSRLLASWWSKHPMRIRDESPDEFAIRTIAWMMIIVAVLLAITVYGTSVAEHGVAQLERRLAQAQVLESAFREAGRLIGGRLQMGAARAQDLHARSAVLRESAARLRGVPRPRPENPAADELEILAQEDDAVYRLFSTMKLGSVLEPQALNGLVEELVTAGLKGFGLGPKLSGRRSSKARLPVSGTSEADPTGDVTPAAAIRNGLTAQIEQTQQEVVNRATAVVAFVGSLVFFTFAGMASGQTRVFVALTGVVVGGLTAGIMLFRVPASVTEHGIQAVAIVLLVSFFNAGRSALAMSALSNPLEPGEHDIHSHTRHIFAGHARSPFSRRLVVGIAITALLSAMTDYWYTEASVIENKASQEAFAHESDFTRGLLDWTTSRVQLFDTATQVLETRQRLGVAAARSELGYLRSGVDRALAQAAVWDAKLRVYEQTYPALLHWLDDPIRGLQGSAPFYQADFPWNMPTAVVGNPTFFRSWALWDAANERAIRAHQSMTALLRALTLFAIALYFLGQALGLGEGSASRLLFRVGIILMLVGGAWSGLSEWYATLAAEVWPGTERCPAFGVDPTRPAADRARVAAEYFYRAHRDRIDGAMQNAARGFDCAIEVRPNFSAARSGRLDILESQYDEVRGLRELASFYQESERGQAELERAFEHSELVVPGSERLWRQRLRLWPPVFRAVAALRTGESVSTMGWMTRHDITKQLERLASEADDPVTHFDLAVSFLAVLSLKQAEREMNLGFENQEKLGPVPQPEILRPQTLDELATLDEYCDKAVKSAGCRELIRRMKDRSIGTGRVKTQSAQKYLGDVVIAGVTSLTVDWRFTLAGIDPASASVTTRLYRVDADGMPYVLDLTPPDPSTIQPDRSEPNLQPPRYTFRQFFVTASYCNDARSFKGELYVNGRLLGEASWHASGSPVEWGRPRMVTTLFPELNLAMCHPADWIPVGLDRLRLSYGDLSTNVSGGSPRLTRGFVTSSGTPAAFIFNQYMPGWSSWGYNDRRVVNDVLTRVIRMGFLSGVPPVRYDCPGASKEWPIYGRSWLDASGVVYAALIFYNEKSPQLDCQVMESIRPMVGMR